MFSSVWGVALASIFENRSQDFLGMGWDFYGLTTKPDNIFMSCLLNPLL